MSNENTHDLPDELVIELRKPVTLGNDVYSELRLREPTAGEVSQALKAGGGLSSDVVLVALVSGVPKPAIDRVGYRDLKRAADYLSGFILGGPATGATS